MYPICNLPSDIVMQKIEGSRTFHQGQGGTIKSYIIRICRREHDNTGLLVGVVEDPEAEEKKAFRTFDELWGILNFPEKGAAPLTRRGAKKDT
jgi:hypothetical protein